MVNPREPGKKLKWGLEDLSPLFRTPASETAPSLPSVRPTSFEVQFVTVCNPDHEGDAFLANAYFASRMVRQENLFASLVSITAGFNGSHNRLNDEPPSIELLESRISRLVLSYEELWAWTQIGGIQSGSQGSISSISKSQPVLVCLDFEPNQFRSLARIALLLDRVVLFIQPKVDSLREAYRLTKILYSLNHEIEFSLLFRGKTSSQGQEEYLFERFSLITSRFLGVSVGWLGDLSFPEKNDSAPFLGRERSEFHPEPILTEEGLARPLSPEKTRFWHELQKMMQHRFSPEFPLSK